MPAFIIQAPFSYFTDNAGNPLNGGKVYTSITGTTTPLATFVDAIGVTPAANPIILDSQGRAQIWASGTYRFRVTDSANNAIGPNGGITDGIVILNAGGDMTKSVYDAANISQQVVGTTAVQSMTNKSIYYTAGNATVAPITLFGGANLTIAGAGAIEYDGKVIYATPQSTQRGIITSEQVFSLNAALAGANVTTAQDIFGVGVTLSSSTQYVFEATCNLSKSAGVTSHTISNLFGGTATLNSISYTQTSGTSVTSFVAGFGGIFMSAPQVATAIVITGAIASAASFYVMRVTGIISVNAGGTFRPQYQLSAAPGGAYSTTAGSTFRIYPVGASGSNINVGAWA